MSVTVNQSETEFDDVIISDWPSVIIWLLIGAGRWQIDLALMSVLYNIYIYIYIYIYSIFLCMQSSHTTHRLVNSVCVLSIVLYVQEVVTHFIY